MANEVETVTKLQDKAVELIDQLTEGLKAVAPQMADVTLAAIRADAIGTLVISGLWSAVWVLGCVAAYRTVRAGINIAPVAKTDYRHAQNEFCLTLKARWLLWIGATGGAISAALLLVNLSCLASRIDWIAAFDPRLALALRVINKLM